MVDETSTTQTTSQPYESAQWSDANRKQWWGDIKDDVTANRNETMEWTEQYNYEPEKVGMLSDRLDTVLADDSKYIQRARTKANEASGARGLLNSSMAAGAAEGAAIDRGLAVAEGDVGVDKFNVGLQNERDSGRYQAAQGIGGASQGALDQIGQTGANFITNAELNKQGHEYNLDEAEQAHEINLQLKNYENDLKRINDEALYTHQRVIEGMGNETALLKSYSDAMGTILSSDLNSKDKAAQVADLETRYQTQIDGLNKWDETNYYTTDAPNTGDYTLGEREASGFSREVDASQIDADYLKQWEASDKASYDKMIEEYMTNDALTKLDMADPVELKMVQDWVYDYNLRDTAPTSTTNNTSTTTGGEEQYFGQGGTSTPATNADAPTNFNMNPTATDMNTQNYIDQVKQYYPEQYDAKQAHLQDIGYMDAFNSGLITESDANQISSILMRQSLAGEEMVAPLVPMSQHGKEFTNSQGQKQVFDDYEVTYDELNSLSQSSDPKVVAGYNRAVSEFNALHEEAKSLGAKVDDYTLQLYARAYLDKYVYNDFGIVNYQDKYAKYGAGAP